MTCDQDHGYGAEQQAYHGGLMDLFVQYTNHETCDPAMYAEPGLVMDYYDGNTVTALWNYAQHFAMSDNSYCTTFGPSTPGALNLVSGQTHGVGRDDPGRRADAPTPYVVVSPDASGVGTVTNDPDPYYDDCSNTKAPRAQPGQHAGQNIGDLLNAKGVTWGWFQGGFRPTTAVTPDGTRRCAARRHTNVGGASRRPTTARTTSRSSTTPRRPTRTTCRRRRSRRSATTTRPTTSTT